MVVTQLVDRTRRKQAHEMGIRYDGNTLSVLSVQRIGQRWLIGNGLHRSEQVMLEGS